jgi:hypothetical protein
MAPPGDHRRPGPHLSRHARRVRRPAGARAERLIDTARWLARRQPWLSQVLSQQMTSPRSAPLPVAPLASTPTRSLPVQQVPALRRRRVTGPLSSRPPLRRPSARDPKAGGDVGRCRPRWHRRGRIGWMSICRFHCRGRQTRMDEQDSPGRSCEPGSEPLDRFRKQITSLDRMGNDDE